MQSSKVEMPPPAYEFGGRNSRRDRRSRPGHEFTFRFPRPTSERPLLTTKRETTPELLVAAQDSEEKAPLKFAAFSELTDSDEADMDVSTDDDREGSRPPRKKRAVEVEHDPPPPAPKWSNPDPYTALPPPDETQTKRPDVVKLIRKARLAAAASSTQTDAVASNDDFISFDMDSLGPLQGTGPPENVPKGPKAARLDGDITGSKKRTYDDELKGISRKSGKAFGGKFRYDGEIVDQWKSHPSDNGTPWLELMEPTLHLGTRLHNEMLAFYHWVKPQPYEDIIRRDLVARLQSAFQKRYYGAEIHSFGSFAFGLYLPVADMDLVLLSTSFMRAGVRSFGERKSQIYAFSAFLRNTDIPVPGSIETIAGARVPILKFVDKLTGLRVDMSFDNDSGLLANQTFQRWKAEYPAMPIIVSVIKQFLLLRGLNEVPTGGLGGFSIICLVVSLLQHLPRGKGNLRPNLGSILMDFFDFYGNKFDYTSVGIKMEPPGFYNKRVYGNSDKVLRLAIDDPNNMDNDISFATKEIRLIFECFSNAYSALRERMIAATTSQSTRLCFLDAIISACYDEYGEQRKQLRLIYENDPRFELYRRTSPPPPPPPTDPASGSDYDPEVIPAPPPLPKTSTVAAALPPRPPPTATNSTKQQGNPHVMEKQLKRQRSVQASRDRAQRLRLLRPDIANAVPASVSVGHAIKLGGYKNKGEMERDLAAREQ